MKATGEVMVIERSFEAALQKGARSLELDGRTLLWEDPAWRTEGDLTLGDLPLGPNDERLWGLMSALRQGATVDELVEHTYIEPWFINALERTVQMERRLLGEELTPALLRSAKRMGFSDRQIGTLADLLPEQVRNQRHEWGLRPVYKTVDTCAAEFEAVTPYYYSTYDQENEALPLGGKRAVVIGSGPIRIGQGIEFDYCSVHAAWALQEDGMSSIMVNSNPETVSTDFDTSDRLYFEPLTFEDVMNIVDREKIDGVIVQFGGQTPLNLAMQLKEAGVPIIGTDPQDIERAENRKLFKEMIEKIGASQPPSGTATSVEEAIPVANSIGYPVLVRPSFVLGGRAMKIVYEQDMLEDYITSAVEASSAHPVLIDKYLEDAIEAVSYTHLTLPTNREV